MAGPNYVLDKGFKVAAGAANVEFGRWCKFNAGTTGDTVTTSGATSAAANPPAVTDFLVGVYQETLDAAKVTTGKATAGVRMLGISRMRSGAAVPLGTRVTSDSTGRAIPVVLTAGQSMHSGGVALTVATAQDQYIDVLLTPGVVATHGGT
jgi:hypothetical protein